MLWTDCSILNTYSLMGHEYSTRPGCTIAIRNHRVLRSGISSSLPDGIALMGKVPWELTTLCLEIYKAFEYIWWSLERSSLLNHFQQRPCLNSTCRLLATSACAVISALVENMNS